MDFAWIRAGLELHQDEDLVARQRLLKRVSEQALLHQTAQVAEAGLQAALEAIRPDVTERQVCAAGVASIGLGLPVVRLLPRPR